LFKHLRLFGAAIALGAFVSLSAGIGGALAANDHTVPPPVSFTDTNPCTGEDTLITQTFTNAVFHESMDTQGGTHVTGTASGIIETDDGFSGRFTGWFGSNDMIGGGDNGVASDTFSATLRNGEGQVVVVHAVEHITLVDGEIIVVFDHSSLECRGKPAA
jgi:hypothetical protein